MVMSMTGFGVVQLKNKRGRVEVEIRGLNHRFLDIVVDLPPKFFILEPKIREELKHKLNRGRIELRLNADKGARSMRSLAMRAIRLALKELLWMRREEGRQIIKDLKMRLKEIQRNLSWIRGRIKRRRIDGVNEEVMRIGFHLRAFRHHLDKSASPLGKELDFIAQELQREANTLSVKSNDYPVVSRVIRIKSEVEKMREQLQNVE